MIRLYMVSAFISVEQKDLQSGRHGGISMRRPRGIRHHLIPPLEGGTRAKRVALSALLVLCVVSVAAVTYILHGNLSTAGFLQIFLVLVVAMRFGFFQATVVSISSFLCLNFLFTEPVFTFVVADPQNWVALFTFEGTALLVSRLSSKVRIHAAEVETQRTRALKLYELSRAILLIDQRRSTSDQIRSLIREIFEVDEVEIWIVPENDQTAEPTKTESTRQAYGAYIADSSVDDSATCFSQRPLRLGTSAFGAITMRGWAIDPLTADAVASLAAITFERARAIHRESRAGVERDAERLRTAVLDGLAHGFKTPLTAIQTASSGLLALDQLNATQEELVSIIDERATMLSQLTTRLLQTAAIEAKEVRLRRSGVSIADLLHRLVLGQNADTRNRTILIVPEKLEDDQVDVPLIALALEQLVDNAAKYSAVGSPIEIRVSQNESETAIIVQNQSLGGASIRPEERTRIFERFYRGTDAVRGPAGTGLGLSIVKKTAEAHGGRVSVECLDETTRFTFAIQHYRKEKRG
jgi:two-component system sensor histidine kinase KdpD